MSNRAAQFLDKLKLEHLDGQKWLVDEPCRFYSKRNLKTYKIPMGTLTDLASIPWFFWWVFPKWGKYNRAAVLHDTAYRHGLIDCLGYPLHVTKETADNLFIEAMLADGVRNWIACSLFWAVRKFGRMSAKRAEV